MLISDIRIIGNKLYNIRKKTGLSQEEAAWQAGLSSRTYADIERGEVNARIESIIKICNVFHITPNDIMTDNDDDSDMSNEDLMAQIDLLPIKEKQVALKILAAYIEAMQYA